MVEGMKERKGRKERSLLLSSFQPPSFLSPSPSTLVPSHPPFLTAYIHTVVPSSVALLHLQPFLLSPSSQLANQSSPFPRPLPCSSLLFSPARSRQRRNIRRPRNGREMARDSYRSYLVQIQTSPERHRRSSRTRTRHWNARHGNAVDCSDGCSDGAVYELEL